MSAAGTHPDLHRLSPEDKSRAIKIDQVRKLVGFATRTAQYSGYRVAIVAPAEALNRNAQNALLKTLEEPGGQTLLLLVCDQPTLLLPTIRSRCQQRILPLPPQEQALEWLQGQVGESARSLLDAAQGAPLRALDLEQASGLPIEPVCWRCWCRWRKGVNRLLRRPPCCQSMIPRKWPG